MFTLASSAVYLLLGQCSKSSQIVLPILGPLHFYMKLKINLLIFAKKKKKGRLDFRRHCIEPVDQFEDCWHLNNIKSSNEHETSFHLLSFS